MNVHVLYVFYQVYEPQPGYLERSQVFSAIIMELS